MRALSLAQAHRCETAQHTVCRCRCAGALHGAAREQLSVYTGRDFYEALPKDDPHHLPDPAEKRQKARDARVKRKLTREPHQQFLYDIFAEDN